MQPSDRGSTARRSLIALVVCVWVLFAILVISGGKLALVQPPSVGLLMILTGVHFIYYREEDAAMFRRQREKWGLNDGWFTPVGIALQGTLLIAMGVIVLVLLIRRR